jgi:hypothetical protein
VPRGELRIIRRNFNRVDDLHEELLINKTDIENQIEHTQHTKQRKHKEMKNNCPITYSALPSVRPWQLRFEICQENCRQCYHTFVGWEVLRFQYPKSCSTFNPRSSPQSNNPYDLAPSFPEPYNWLDLVMQTPVYLHNPQSRDLKLTRQSCQR